jgi:hypothetical protein
VGAPLSFAHEAEGGAGSMWKISYIYPNIDIASFFMGFGHILYKKVNRPGL